MQFEIQSKGLHSTWVNIAEANIAFDAGEGMSTYLGARSGTIRKLFLSHSHVDHVAGVLPLIMSRNSGVGDNANLPLDIYYPEGTRFITEIQKMQEDFLKVGYPLTWNPIQPGAEIALPAPEGSRNPKRVRAFEVAHGNPPPGVFSLGFSLLETVQRLKPEYRQYGEVELTRMRLDGRELRESYDRKLLVYSGDCITMPAEELQEAQILIHDANFLKTEDRKEGSKSHATLSEAARAAQNGRVKKAYFCHVSPRYKKNDILEAQGWLDRKRIPGEIIPHHRPLSYDQNGPVIPSRGRQPSHEMR